MPPSSTMVSPSMTRSTTQQTVRLTNSASIRGMLFIKGSVPGHKGSWLTVTDAIKLPRHDSAPYPAGLVETKMSRSSPIVASGQPAATAPWQFKVAIASNAREHLRADSVGITMPRVR